MIKWLGRSSLSPSYNGLFIHISCISCIHFRKYLLDISSIFKNTDVCPSNNNDSSTNVILHLQFLNFDSICVFLQIPWKFYNLKEFLNLLKISRVYLKIRFAFFANGNRCCWLYLNKCKEKAWRDSLGLKNIFQQKLILSSLLNHMYCIVQENSSVEVLFTWV